jgi:hypothetical protein
VLFIFFFQEKSRNKFVLSTMKIDHVYTVPFLLFYAATLPISTTAFIQCSIRRNGVVPAPWGLKWTTTRREQRGLYKDDAFASLSYPPLWLSASLDDDELDEERKANLFQFLLRDLQVEGVPLLAVDSNQVETLQAAVWTTMAELMEEKNDDNNNDQQQKVCLVFEDIPMDALRSLADEFMMFKTQRINQTGVLIPELERVSLSLLGKGKVGPAMILEVSANDATRKTTSSSSSTIAANNNNNNNNNNNKANDNSLDEIKYTAAMKAFSSRLLDQTDVYPYKQDDGDHCFNTAYRFCRSTDVSHIMSSFWNCICELTANPDNIAMTVLVLPGLQDDR